MLREIEIVHEDFFRNADVTAKMKLTIIDEEEMWGPYLESRFAPEPGCPGTTATAWSRHGPQEKGAELEA